MYNIAPSLSDDLFTKISPRDRFRGFVSSARNFSKCSAQIWYWLSLSKFAILLCTSHSLKRGLFFNGSRRKLISLFESLGVLFEHPTTAHSAILNWCCLLEISEFRPMYAVTSCYAPKTSTWLPNGGRSICSGTELFAVTVRLKGKFTS